MRGQRRLLRAICRGQILFSQDNLMIKSITLLASDDAERERNKHPSREVGVLLLEDERGRFLFVRTRKLPQSWQPLGGGKDAADASLVDTVLRELKEEALLELTAADIKFVLETPYDFGEGRVQFYRAKLPKETQMTLDPQEIVDSRWLTLEEAEKLPMFPATRACIEFLIRQT